MVYSFDSRVRYSEVDCNGRLSIPSLINYFQDCSTFHSEDIGQGFRKIIKRGRVWILSSWHIEINSLPSICQKITIKTFATKFSGSQGHRNFVLVDQDDKCLAYANSIWVLMDINNGRPTKITQADYEGYGGSPALNMEEVGRKIQRIEGTTTFPTFVVKRQHLDTNNHVNNSQYVQMALEVLPADIEIKRLRVEYKKAAIYQDVITPKIARDSKRTLVELCDDIGAPYTIIEVITQ